MTCPTWAHLVTNVTTANPILPPSDHRAIIVTMRTPARVRRQRTHSAPATTHERHAAHTALRDIQAMHRRPRKAPEVSLLPVDKQLNRKRAELQRFSDACRGRYTPEDRSKKDAMRKHIRNLIFKRETTIWKNVAIRAQSAAHSGKLDQVYAIVNEAITSRGMQCDFLLGHVFIFNTHRRRARVVIAESPIAMGIRIHQLHTWDTLECLFSNTVCFRPFIRIPRRPYAMVRFPSLDVPPPVAAD